MENIIFLCICILFAIVLFFISPFYAYGTKRTVTFTIKEKGTLTHGYVNDGNGQTQTDFMIYTKDNRVLKNVNSLWYWKWRSTELQSKIKVGKKYTATIYGWRIGALHFYPNIVDIKEVKNK